MAHALALDFLTWLPRAFLYLAMAAWTVVFAGLMRQMARRLQQSMAPKHA